MLSRGGETQKKMALAKLVQMIAKTLRGGNDDTRGAYVPVSTTQCGSCGKFFPDADLVNVVCFGCDTPVRVCMDDKTDPSCLKCSHTDACSTCALPIRERYGNKVVCMSCESEIVVCDLHIPQPTCSACVGRE